ncbi:hypothetical protein CRG98_021338 [Punica granatum]|uniref:Uncharacterized protein n=1 Tax=Punica granatum TaxID=22663 RepID=A0A2I0JRZ4_PUNGR|nr:hypothetical protein CRG98_021338 [Punica granatum]
MRATSACSQLCGPQFSLVGARMLVPMRTTWECPPSWGRTTDAREKKSLLTVYDPKSLEIHFRQTKIAVISGLPEQLRKQYEKSRFGLLGRLRLHICYTGLRCTCHCSRVQTFGDARARPFSSHHSCTLRPWAPDIPSLHAHPIAHMSQTLDCTSSSSACAHLHACTHSSAPARLLAHLFRRLSPSPARARLVAHPSSPERVARAPKHPLRDSTKSLDSQTLPRLFPRIPMLGITLLT